MGSGFAQEMIDHGFVLIGDIADGCGQSEHHMVIRDRQQFGLACIQPTLGRRGLAFGTMAVATGVVGDLDLLAPTTTQHMAAQRRAAAAFDGRHGLELAQA